MFVFGAIILCVVMAALSATYVFIPAKAATFVRLAVSAVLTVGGVLIAVIVPIRFGASEIAANEWADSAFRVFFDPARIATAVVAALLVLGTALAKRRSRIVMCVVSGALYTAVLILVTAFFSLISRDEYTLVHTYMETGGLGLAAVSASAVLCASVRELASKTRNNN